MRQKIIKSNLTKGKLLDDIFTQEDYLWSTDQGKSFKAFWEFLMSPAKQQELEDLIEVVFNLPEIKIVHSEYAFNRIKNNLVNAGEKIERTNDSLIEQLRKYLEQKSLLESKKILRSIEEIERVLIDHKPKICSIQPSMEIDGIIHLDMIMERPLYKLPTKVKFSKLNHTLGLANVDDSKLYQQFYIDEEILKRNIKDILKHETQVTLKEISEKHRIRRGIAEVVGYMHIASKEKKHSIDENETEEILVENYQSQKKFLINIPQITFHR